MIIWLALTHVYIGEILVLVFHVALGLAPGAVSDADVPRINVGPQPFRPVANLVVLCSVLPSQTVLQLVDSVASGAVALALATRLCDILRVYIEGCTISRFSVAGSHPARLEFTRFDPFSAAFDDVTNQRRGPRSAWAWGGPRSNKV
jgi:hypothetical protein